MPFLNDAACTITKRGLGPSVLQTGVSKIKQYRDLRRVHGSVCVCMCVSVCSHQLNIGYFIVRLLDLLVEMIPLLIGA